AIIGSVEVVEVVLGLHERGTLSKTADGWLCVLPEDRPLIYGRTREVGALHRKVVEYVISRLKEGAIRDTAMAEFAFYHASHADAATLCYELLFNLQLAERLQSAGRCETLAQFCLQLIGCSDFEQLSNREKARSYLCQGSALLYLAQWAQASDAALKSAALFKECHDQLGTAEAYSELVRLAGIASLASQ